MTLTRDQYGPERRGGAPAENGARTAYDNAAVSGASSNRSNGNGHDYGPARVYQSGSRSRGHEDRGHGGNNSEERVTGYGKEHYPSGQAGDSKRRPADPALPSGGYPTTYRSTTYASTGGGSYTRWDDEFDDDESEGIGRALLASVVSVFLPGVGHAMAGHKRTGRILLTALFVLLAAGAIAYAGLGRARIVALSVDSTALTWLVYGSVGLGIAWALVVVSAFLVNRPPVMTSAERAAATAVIGLLALALVATGGIVAYYLNTQRDLVTSLAPEGAKEKPNFFANKPRVNIMLLGSDAGDGRIGVRTDTVIVASIDTKTGRTVMFSLPRNLQRMPFAKGTRAAKEFPFGFGGPGSVDFYLLNAVYKYGQEHRNLVPGAANPGETLLEQAVEGTLGLEVDYYVMIDLKGFEGIVDALGGIKIVVKKENGKPIPIGGKHNADGSVVLPTGFLPLGRQKLNGHDALWYARSRFYSDDYHRMARQQCVLGAIARQATPINVLKGYQKLAKTAKKSIESDIPGDALESLVTLAAQGKTAKITTISFDDKLIKTADPDYAVIQRKVEGALEEAEDDAKPSPTSRISGTPAAMAPVAHTVDLNAQSGRPTPKPGAAVSVDKVCQYW